MSAVSTFYDAEESSSDELECEPEEELLSNSEEESEWNTISVSSLRDISSNSTNFFDSLLSESSKPNFRSRESLSVIKIDELKLFRESFKEEASIDSNTDGSSNDSNTEGSTSEDIKYRQEQFRILNMDSGESCDVCDFDSLNNRLTVFPDRKSLMLKDLTPSIDSHTTSFTDISITDSRKDAKPWYDTFYQSLKLGLKQVYQDSFETEGSTAGKDMLLISSLLKAHEGPILCMEFSLDGKYLATAGEDEKVLVWRVSPQVIAEEPKHVDAVVELGKLKLSQELGKLKHSQFDYLRLSSNCKKEDISDTKESDLGQKIKVLSTKPIQTYTDHNSTVVSLSFSQNCFLLSASFDKTVRLYHTSREACLHVFHHPSMISSVCFHPKDGQYFISAGFDNKMRLWSIPDGVVHEWVKCPDIITSVGFSPDAKLAIAGLYCGSVHFYEVPSMRYFTQIECKSRRGESKKGRKVTGFDFIMGYKERKSEQITGSLNPAVRTEHLLITTNDSKLRLFSMYDYCMKRKYKGALNNRMQIKARFSESGQSIICGSECGDVVIWPTRINKNKRKHVFSPQNSDQTKSYSYFKATDADPDIITNALFVPATQCKNALFRSGLFPNLKKLDHVLHDFSDKIVITSDYDGAIRVFVRQDCIGKLFDASKDMKRLKEAGVI